MAQRIENYPKYALHLIGLMVLQIFIFNRMSVQFEIPKIHVYILFIIILPNYFNRAVLLLGAFTIGLVVDSFDNSMGLNAATATFVAFIKSFFSPLLVESKTTEAKLKLIPTLATYGMGKMMRFIGVLLLFHFLFYYFFEAFSLNNVWHIIGRALYSTVLSFICALFYNVLFNNK